MTISRIVDVFNTDRRSYIRQQLSNSLGNHIAAIDFNDDGRGVVSQNHAKYAGCSKYDKGRKEHQLYSVKQVMPWECRQWIRALFKLFIKQVRFQGIVPKLLH